MKRATGDNGEPDCAIMGLIGGILVNVLWTLAMPYVFDCFVVSAAEIDRAVYCNP